MRQSIEAFRAMWGAGVMSGSLPQPPPPDMAIRRLVENVVDQGCQRLLRLQGLLASDHGRLEIPLVPFKVENTIFQVLAVRTPGPAESPAMFEN